MTYCPIILCPTHLCQQISGVSLLASLQLQRLFLLYIIAKRPLTLAMKSAHAVFFDLNKAFDTVPHNPLLHKLSEHQIDPFLIRWVRNYLMDRTQSVVLGGAQSDSLPVMSGVPQESVLGPLLFLIYIDGVSSSVVNSKITLYADDIALHKIIKNPRDYTLFQEDINSLCIWIANNHLILNILKCCYIVFSRKQHSAVPDIPLYVGDSHQLAKEDHIKYLGVTFTSDLTWFHHINSVCKKTRRLIGMLYRNFSKFSDSTVLLKFYKSLIRPHLEYASVAWDPHLIKDVKLIEDVQKFALRVCSKTWNSSYDSLLRSCNLSALSDRRKTLKLCLLYNILSDRSFILIHPLKNLLVNIRAGTLTAYSCLCSSGELKISNIRSSLQPLPCGTP